MSQISTIINYNIVKLYNIYNYNKTRKKYINTSNTKIKEKKVLKIFIYWKF